MVGCSPHVVIPTGHGKFCLSSPKRKPLLQKICKGSCRPVCADEACFSDKPFLKNGVTSNKTCLCRSIRQNHTSDATLRTTVCLLAASSILKCDEEAITVAGLQIRIDERKLALLLFLLFDPKIVLAYLKG